MKGRGTTQRNRRNEQGSMPGQERREPPPPRPVPGITTETERKEGEEMQVRANILFFQGLLSPDCSGRKQLGTRHRLHLSISCVKVACNASVPFLSCAFDLGDPSGDSRSETTPSSLTGAAVWLPRPGRVSLQAIPLRHVGCACGTCARWGWVVGGQARACLEAWERWQRVAECRYRARAGEQEEAGGASERRRHPRMVVVEINGKTCAAPFCKLAKGVQP